jgi:hypothetical protein
MPTPAPEPSPPCTFCGAAAAPALYLARFNSCCCTGCAARVGRLLAKVPEQLTGAFPALGVEDAEDALDPEPRVRGSDGKTRELREVTAELKRELPLAARAQLAQAYGEMGMPREQVQECAHVLAAAEEPALLQHAVDLLFSETLCSPGGVDVVRSRLFPS